MDGSFFGDPPPKVREISHGRVDIYAVRKRRIASLVRQKRRESCTAQLRCGPLARTPRIVPRCRRHSHRGRVFFMRHNLKTEGCCCLLPALSLLRQNKSRKAAQTTTRCIVDGSVKNARYGTVSVFLTQQSTPNRAHNHLHTRCKLGCLAAIRTTCRKAVKDTKLGYRQRFSLVRITSHAA